MHLPPLHLYSATPTPTERPLQVTEWTVDSSTNNLNIIINNGCNKVPTACAQFNNDNKKLLETTFFNLRKY